jgi:hypothetical protein
MVEYIHDNIFWAEGGFEMPFMSSCPSYETPIIRILGFREVNGVYSSSS